MYMNNIFSSYHILLSRPNIQHDTVVAFRETREADEPRLVTGTWQLDATMEGLSQRSTLVLFCTRKKTGGGKLGTCRYSNSFLLGHAWLWILVGFGLGIKRFPWRLSFAVNSCDMSNYFSFFHHVRRSDMFTQSCKLLFLSGTACMHALHSLAWRCPKHMLVLANPRNLPTVCLGETNREGSTVPTFPETLLFLAAAGLTYISCTKD